MLRYAGEPPLPVCMFAWRPVCLFVCRSVCPCACLSACLSACLPVASPPQLVCLSVCRPASLHLSYVSVVLSVCQTVGPSVGLCISVWRHVCLLASLPVRLLSVFMSVCSHSCLLRYMPACLSMHLSIHRSACLLFCMSFCPTACLTACLSACSIRRVVPARFPKCAFSSFLIVIAKNKDRLICFFTFIHVFITSHRARANQCTSQNGEICTTIEEAELKN